MSHPALPVTSLADVTQNFERISKVGVPLMLLDHDPTDADMDFPQDGYGAINYTTHKLFFRILGVWRTVTLT